ncbi:MAG TPA: NapC/NirT family cytochrome c [Deltaproteobacteria bacterium]|nr:NapC/NirT family cytochrome c [Deltaproteobacteria bacterium]
MGYRDILRAPALRILAAGVVVGVVFCAAVVSGYHASGNPAFCTACHSMKDVGDTWGRSLHKQYACIECHLPDSNLVAQAAYKTRAGLNDLYHETLRSYPASLRLSDEGRGIVEGNCLRCHFSTVQNTFMASPGTACLNCHRALIHGTGLVQGGISVE